MLVTKSPTLCALLCMGFVVANATTIVDVSFDFDEKTQELLNVDIQNSFMTTVVREKSGSPRYVYVNHTTLDDTSASRKCAFEVQDNDVMMGAYPVGPHQFLLISTYPEGSSSAALIRAVVYDTTDCKQIYENHLEFDSFHDAQSNFVENSDAILIKDDETFSIFYNGHGDKLSTLEINFESKKGSKSTSSFAPLRDSYRFIIKEPSTSNFVVTELKLDEAYRITLVKPDAQVVLKQYDSYDDMRDHDISYAHGVIRICSKTDTNKVECEVFDDNGKSTSKVSVNVPHKVEIVDIQNLDDGKFLLLSADEKTGAALMKLNGDGTLIGVAKLPDFAGGNWIDCESHLDVDDNQAYVTRKCSGTQYLKVAKVRFGDSDFH